MRPEDWQGSSSQRCPRSDPHESHLWNPAPITITEPPTSEGWVSVPLTALTSCPGWQGLAPERDRPEHPEFDWTPEALNLSAAALQVVHLHKSMADDNAAMPGYGERTRARYTGALAVWSLLTDMDEPAALTFALQIADAVPPVMGVPVPF